MKIGITHRLFLSILAATLLAILCMFLIMLWSIDRGFLEYLNSLDQGRLEQLAARLEQLYADYGGWGFLQERPLFRILRQLNALREEDWAPERLKGREAMDHVPPEAGPPRAASGPAPRIVLLDAERKPLFGKPADTAEVNFRSIVHKGETVGYLGFLPPKHFLNPQQLLFLRQQRLALVLAAAGVILAVALISLPLADRLVRPIRAMGTATRDIASGKYRIRVPVSSSDEVGQLARDFNAMAIALEENEKARRQWVADISHELRTPLAVLRGEIEALMDGVHATTPQAIGSLHAEVMRLHRLVEDLYQLSLTDLGALAYRKEELDPAQVLRESTERYRPEFDRKGISLVVSLPEGDSPRLFGDRERIGQLFANLIENSLKYTDPGGELAIRSTCTEDRVTIEFQDSAPGVKAGELDRLFDRLYRVEGSRSRASGGAGLGLAICKNIVEAHGGTISAHQSALGGLLIRVAMPAEVRP